MGVEYQMNIKKIIISLIFLSLILILGCEKTIEVPYKVNETYVEKEEYTTLVQYEEQEEYTEPLKYEVIEAKKEGYLDFLKFNYLTKGSVKVKNVDIETGDFIVEQTFETLNDPPVTNKTKKRITAGETLEFVEIYDSDEGEDVRHTYKIIPNGITKFRTVTKYRNETRVRDVEKVREVIKTREEKRSRFS